MTPNGFFRVCQNGEGPTFARLIREIKQLLCVQSLVLYYIKQIDSMLPCICPVIDHRGRPNNNNNNNTVLKNALYISLNAFT